VFLNRTSGESIGFTVLGVMVIDKNSVVSVSAPHFKKAWHLATPVLKKK
jgi:hypothetical protein